MNQFFIIINFFSGGLSKTNSNKGGGLRGLVKPLPLPLAPQEPQLKTDQLITENTKQETFLQPEPLSQELLPPQEPLEPQEPLPDTKGLPKKKLPSRKTLLRPATEEKKILLPQPLTQNKLSQEPLSQELLPPQNSLEPQKSLPETKGLPKKKFPPRKILIRPVLEEKKILFPEPLAQKKLQQEPVAQELLSSGQESLTQELLPSATSKTLLLPAIEEKKIYLPEPLAQEKFPLEPLTQELLPSAQRTFAQELLPTSQEPLKMFSPSKTLPVTEKKRPLLITAEPSLVQVKLEQTHLLDELSKLEKKIEQKFAQRKLTQEPDFSWE